MSSTSGKIKSWSCKYEDTFTESGKQNDEKLYATFCLKITTREIKKLSLKCKK